MIKKFRKNHIYKLDECGQSGECHCILKYLTTDVDKIKDITDKEKGFLDNWQRPAYFFKVIRQFGCDERKFCYITKFDTDSISKAKEVSDIEKELLI